MVERFDLKSLFMFKDSSALSKFFFFFFFFFNYSASKVLTFIKGQCLIWTFKELHIPQLHDMIDISHLNI